MSFFRRVVTYHIPSEADIDRSLLESRGITVNLLNANVSRAEIGSPFHIQLEVPDDQYAEAVAILRELRPERFGSAEKVKQIEAALFRSLVRSLIIASVVGVAVYSLRSGGGYAKVGLGNVMGHFFRGGLHGARELAWA